ncbi:INO80 complex subunit E-like [Mytilus californianus]|uniref:INO80 complex subunit E-like n=1 Tax=Mytilus californianus TaxID=6549 RepID=UPI002247BD9F|nr:INO80 complex subunit E-like [Mytilus californianus]
MMPIPEGQIPHQEHQVEYREKYKALKKKLKFLVYEQECFLEELRKSQRKLLKITRDRSFLLDRLLQYEKLDDSSDDSDATASSDSENDGHSAGKKRKALESLGFEFGTDPTLYMAASAQSRANIPTSSEPVKKRSKPSAKKGKGGKLSHQEPQLTREEVEKRLESRQISFGIEKAPMMLPMEIFSHDNSNQDSEGNDRDDEDSDLVIDTQ